MHSFDQIIGNLSIIQSLKNSIKNDRISHAYIIDGKEKTGKKMIANAFAKLLLCQNPQDEPCQKCSSCISIETGNNPDFFIVKPDKNSLGIAEIREKVIKNIETKPFKYKYKIFIIYAYNITVQAQNAMLKTIEEPPEFAIFILITQNYNRFLETIISRCILFKLKPISINIIEQFLMKNNVDLIKSKLYASYSKGSIGKALEVSLSNDFIAFRGDIINNIKNLENMNLIQMYTFIEKLEEDKKNIQKVLDIFLSIYRDALIYRKSFDKKMIIQKDIVPIIEKIAKFSTKRLITSIQTILNSKMYLEQNSNFNMTLECLFLKLKEK